LLYRI
jgi:hypothetical protein